jgi:hypothetical protein
MGYGGGGGETEIDVYREFGLVNSANQRFGKTETKLLVHLNRTDLN